MKQNPIPFSKRYHLVLSAVHMVYRLVNSTFTVKELTLRTTRLLCQFIHASSASVYLIHPAKKNVVVCASFDNQINIWRDKPTELKNIPEDVLSVTRGASVLKDDCMGLPLVADDYLGAIFVRRQITHTHQEEGKESPEKKQEEGPFGDFDYEMLSVFAEQVVTAMKNLQLHQAQEKVMSGAMTSMDSLLKKQSCGRATHTTVYLKIARLLAIALDMNHDLVKHIEYAAMLHDAGMINIPTEILTKQGPLSSAELKLVYPHTAQSVALVSSSEFLEKALPVILHHHERYDGTGYPSGLKKEQIPIGARVLACVDAVEAMLQGRPYRPSISNDQMLAELTRCRGTQFDPKVVDAFIRLASQKKLRKLLSLLKPRNYNKI
ncbi:MAG: HD domain-containing protein [Candidatus Omnitrophica bacterium]|nr:HD domain-containing protein [Candidatus Omnitrophota bacterium]